MTPATIILAIPHAVVVIVAAVLTALRGVLLAKVERLPAQEGMAPGATLIGVGAVLTLFLEWLWGCWGCWNQVWVYLIVDVAPSKKQGQRRSGHD
jgi:hypothetical protein